MRIGVTLDDDLLLIAREYTGLTKKSALVQEALKALIERESSRRLAALGGTMPELEAIPRREFP
ncbi:MAG: type II toxin-antitoxin system VapB family antitoxin [Terracidiphilus sp.]|jgi:Arc/MetJ family transcription regulator